MFIEICSNLKFYLTNCQDKNDQKRCQGKTSKIQKRKSRRKVSRQQLGRFSNRYDFAYAGRDTANQAMTGLATIAPKLINQTTKEVDRVAQVRIRQLIKDGGKQVEKIAPKLRRGAIEDMYKTPFRLRGNFGKKNLAQVKRKLLGIIRK